MPITHEQRKAFAAATLAALAFTATLLLPSSGAGAAELTVGLGVADSFAILAGTGVTNTGPSVIDGDLGTCPTPAVTGFPPGVVVGGSVHANDALACAAKADLQIAYDDAASRAPLVAFAVPTDLGGMTLVSGTYSSPTSFGLTGTLTLDAQGDPTAAFIFQAGSTVVTATDSNVVLVNGAQACNVFWQVGSSATLGVRTTFVGSVLALTSITATTNATVAGRLLARNGATTLDSNLVTTPVCAAAPPTTTTGVAPTTSTTGVAPTTTTTAVAPTTTTTAVAPTTTTTVVTPPTTTTTVVTPPTTTTTAVTPTTTTTVVGATTTTSLIPLPPTTTTSTTALAATTTTTAVETPRAVATTTTTPRQLTPTTAALTTTARTPRLPDTGEPVARSALLGLAVLALGYATLRVATPLVRRGD